MKLLRTTVTLIFLSVITDKALAQQRNSVFIYSDMGFGFGYPWRVNIRANCLFLRHHQVSFGFDHIFRRASGLPGNYESNNEVDLPFSRPLDVLDGSTIFYGYALYPRKQSGMVRIVMRAGILLGKYKEPWNFQYNGSRSFVPNYTYETSGKNSLAFIVDPSVEYTATRAFGFTAGPYAVFNEHMAGAGIRVGLLLGKLSSVRRRQAAL